MQDKELQTRDKEELQTAGESTRPGPVFVPPVDIFETEEALTLLADMPGVTKKRVSIDVDNDELTITGEVPAREEGGRRPLLEEYGTGTFRRVFTLSERIDQERITASMDKGVLRLVLPKVERARRKRIEVTAS
jgi:HSP20 family protein